MQQDLKKPTIRGVIWTLAERFSAQGISLVVSIVLARLLLPDDYSVIGIVTIFFTFCEVFVTGGFNTALIQKKDADTLDFSIVLFVSLSISTVLYVGMFFCAPLIARIYDKAILVPVIRVMGIMFFINAVKSVVSAYVSNKLQFRKFFFATLGGLIVSAIVGIVMAMKGFGPWALVAQQLTNGLIGTVVLLLVTKFKIVFGFSLARFRALFNYGWKIFVSSLIDTTYNEIKPLIVGTKFSTEDLAFYNKGRSFPQVINSSVCSTVSSVLFPVISKVQDDRKATLSMTRRFIQISSYIVFPIMLGLLSVADTFVSVLLTDKWLPCVPYIQIFAFSYMFNMIQTGNLQTIRAIGRSDIILKLEVIKKSLFLVVITLFIIFSSSPQMLALSGIITTLIATACNSIPNQKLIGYKMRYQVWDILPNLLLASSMGVVVFLVGKVVPSSVWGMLIQIATGVVFYLLVSLITRNASFKYLLSFVRSFKAKKAEK